MVCEENVNMHDNNLPESLLLHDKNWTQDVSIIDSEVIRLWEKKEG